MAKVIKPADKFKPIKCRVCGCNYEHEQGDYIETTYYVIRGEKYVVCRKLECPACGNDNILEVEGEE